MKAIDFACRFLTRAHRDDLSEVARLVLIAVAAGLEEKEDIARETGIAPSVCTNQLRLLLSRGELRRISIFTERYVLAPVGRQRIRRLFDFHYSYHDQKKAEASHD